MAVTLPEEVLRAVQDTLPLHQAIFSKYAQHGPSSNIPPASCHAYMDEHASFVSFTSRVLRLVNVAALVHADNMEGPLLDWGRFMGKLGGEKTLQ